MAQSDWAIQLFNKSVLKQQKFKEITAMLGSTDRLDCLDIGGDNGVISYMLRSQGGNWKSADLDTESVAAIEELIQSKVYRIDNDRLPFSTKEFDRIVVVDFLEHIQDEKWFFEELQRILKPGGILLLNVPHLKNDLLRKLRILLGQTDEKHGHLRPGYTMTMVEKLIEDKFILLEYKTYSKFFSEFLDLVIVGLVSRIQQNN
ncbi:MAG: class I SAM-dependent methyltransferase, partial [Chloroflexota bacterium]